MVHAIQQGVCHACKSLIIKYLRGRPPTPVQVVDYQTLTQAARAGSVPIVCKARSVPTLRTLAHFVLLPLTPLFSRLLSKHRAKW